MGPFSAPRKIADRSKIARLRDNSDFDPRKMPSVRGFEKNMKIRWKNDAKMRGFWWLGTKFGVILFAYLSCLRQNSAAGQVGEAFCKGGVPSMDVSVDWVQVLCEIGCRKVNFEETWRRKNVEPHKNTKCVKILRMSALILQSYAPQIPFWCMMVPPKSEMWTECSYGG